MKKCLLPVLTTIIIIIGLLIICIPILSGIFFVTFDQARDLIWVKNQVDFSSPSLIGPPGSLEGVFFGPLWLWLLTLPYVISKGNPVVTTLFNSVVILGAGVLAASLIWKYHKYTAYFLLILTFCSPAIHALAGYAFAQHMLPILTVILIYSYAHILRNGDKRYFFIAVFSIALMFHAEPVVSVFSLFSIPFILWFSPNRKKILNFKTVLFVFIIFCIPFLPSIVFDIKHDFLQTRGVIAYLTGTSKSLGDILPFSQRLIDRPTLLFYTYQSSIIRQSSFLAVIFLLVTFFVIKKMPIKPFLKKVAQASILYFVSLWIVFTIFPPQFKDFYLNGVVIIYFFWTAITFGALWEKTQLRIFLSVILILICWYNLEPLKFYNSWKNNFINEQKSTSIFKTQKAIVDHVYKDSNGDGFNVYTYSSAIYDYPYQYLFLQYGIHQYGYLPHEFSYLPNQPQYVQKKDLQLKKHLNIIKPAKEFLYLIIEPGQYSNRRDNWLTNFPANQYQPIWQHAFPDGTLVEKRRIL